ncbi:MAG: glycosyltransferase [Flavobacteriaceae bacterium CG_4_8_14_3_um_filter_34_10]|nr:glycosyltransferase [Flavobacteriia bacterium]PIV48991.1 MAG: glycosyltransferase [Flavobacteriaceae bacterium CG02_land_8_20_14_3_00_34_13]PIX08965.1 MAG: glycosyltransferase [Flavobacteriaceae bacterium CG_4_8_14_3_um_filter_34_10]
MKLLHIIDSLHAGGAERMAVTYANALAQHGEEVHLWSTREEGILKASLSNKVAYRFLRRKGRVGWKALWEAKKYIKKEGIQLIHAHSTSFFFATLLKTLCPKVKLVWHDHYGNSELLEHRSKTVLKVCSKYFDAIFVVNKQLQIWATAHLYCKSVYYIKNFIGQSGKNTPSTLQLNGEDGKRMVCLANLRAQKSHILLLEAFSKLAIKHSDWSLHLLGANWQDAYFEKVISFIKKNQLEQQVFYYGSQQRISGILPQCEVGVLTSTSEGLPLALLEYGMAGLAVVTTDVGYCKEVVHGYGKVVPSEQVEALVEAMQYYITHEVQRQADAAAFHKHINATYTEDAVLPEVVTIYRSLIG